MVIFIKKENLSKITYIKLLLQKFLYVIFQFYLWLKNNKHGTLIFFLKQWLLFYYVKLNLYKDNLKDKNLYMINTKE